MKKMQYGIDTMDEVNNMEKKKERSSCKIVEGRIIGIKDNNVEIKQIIEKVMKMRESNMKLSRKTGNLPMRQSLKYQK